MLYEVITATYAKSGLFGYYWNKASQNAVRRAQVVNVTAGKTYKVTINYKFIGGTGSTTPYNAFYFIPVGETFTATVDYTKAETTTGSKEYVITSYSIHYTKLYEHIAKSYFTVLSSPKTASSNSREKSFNIVTG